jgi:hypothetical protein
LIAAAQHLCWPIDGDWIERLARSINAVPTETKEADSTH